MIIDVVVPCAIQCTKKLLGRGKLLVSAAPAWSSALHAGRQLCRRVFGLLEIFSVGFGTSVDSEKSAACLTVVGLGK